MSARKSERLINLLITLLVSRTYVTKARLRQTIPAYREAASDDAFEKMFERDKEELRALGVPIEVGSHEPLFDDAQGYRVVRSTFELPDISLQADEAAVVGLAARVWQQAGLASATSDALRKLKAAGVEVDRTALDVVAPQVAADEPAFAPLWEAVTTRRPVTFDYRASAAAEPATRQLHPWGIVSFRSRWYVVGHDLDRDEPRLFRLSRVVGSVRFAGKPDAFTVPERTDIRALTGMLAPERADRSAWVRVRPGKAVALRHRALEAVRSADGWDRIQVPFGRTDSLVDELASYGPDVVADAPDDLREAVVERLRGSTVVSSSRGQVNRLLALVPYLQARGEIPVDEAARDFEVSPRTILEDINVLLYCGLPGLGMGDLIEVDFEALEGDGVIRLSNADYLTRPLRLDSTEAAALVVGLRALLEGSADSEREVVTRALAKIEEAAGEAAALAARLDVRTSPSPDEEALGRRLLEAVAAGVQVRISHRSPVRDELTTRVVDPIAVGSSEGHRYLDAWCHLVEDRRLFRLDRVAEAEVLDTPVSEQAALTPLDLSEGLFRPTADALRATLRVTARARWVAEYFPVDEATDEPDGGMTVTLRVGDPAWLVRLMLRLGGEATLVEPGPLAAEVRTTAQAALEHYT